MHTHCRANDRMSGHYSVYWLVCRGFMQGDSPATATRCNFVAGRNGIATQASAQRRHITRHSCVA